MKPMEIRTLYNRLKASAAKRDIEFNLSLVDLNNLSFPITCPVLGIPLHYNRGEAKDDSYSIDRIDSTKGYSIENIEVISLRANKLKSNATIEEIVMLAEYYKEKI
jgi:hypothetical protein